MWSLFQRTLGKLANSQCAQCSKQRAFIVIAKSNTNPVLSHPKEGFIMLPSKQSLLFLLHNPNKWNNMPEFCFTQQQIGSNMPEFKTVNTIYVLQSSVLNLPRSTETSPVDHEFSSTNTFDLSTSKKKIRYCIFQTFQKSSDKKNTKTHYGYPQNGSELGLPASELGTFGHQPIAGGPWMLGCWESAKTTHLGWCS